MADEKPPRKDRFTWKPGDIEIKPPVKPPPKPKPKG